MQLKEITSKGFLAKLKNPTIALISPRLKDIQKDLKKINCTMENIQAEPTAYKPIPTVVHRHGNYYMYLIKFDIMFANPDAVIEYSSTVYDIVNQHVRDIVVPEYCNGKTFRNQSKVDMRLAFMNKNNVLDKSAS